MTPSLEELQNNVVAVVATYATKAEAAAASAEESRASCSSSEETCKEIMKGLPSKVEEALAPLKKSVDTLVKAEEDRKAEQAAQQAKIQKYKAWLIAAGSSVCGYIASNAPAILEALKGVILK